MKHNGQFNENMWELFLHLSFQIHIYYCKTHFLPIASIVQELSKNSNQMCIKNRVSKLPSVPLCKIDNWKCEIVVGFLSLRRIAIKNSATICDRQLS